MNRDEAASRYAAGHGYVRAIEIIVSSPETHHEAGVIWTSLPLNLLAGFALELFFKAWLLASNRSSVEVYRYRHDIARLYADALAAELIDVEGLSSIVESLAEGHKRNLHRYIASGTEFSVMRWIAVVPVLRALDAAVEAKIAFAGTFQLISADGEEPPVGL